MKCFNFLELQVRTEHAIKEELTLAPTEDYLKAGKMMSALGAPILRNINIRGLDRPVKKETEKERKLRLVAADMKPLSAYWSKGKI